MRLMLLIIGLVLSSFILLNAIKRRKLKRQVSMHEEFEKKILKQEEQLLPLSYDRQMGHVEKMLDNKEEDPLFEGLSSSAKPINTPVVDELNTPEELLEDIEEIKIEDTKPKKSKPQEFIVLTILPEQAGYFSANTVMAALVKNHFKYGKQKLYHRHLQDNAAFPIIYSVGSLSKPGYFEQDSKTSYHRVNSHPTPRHLDTLRHPERSEGSPSKQTLPGIFIYMVMDELVDPKDTFEKMLTCARQLSAMLNAQLCDAKHHPLTTLEIKKIREKIKACALKIESPQEEYEVW